jgi:hypothetical protein
MQSFSHTVWCCSHRSSVGNTQCAAHGGMAVFWCARLGFISSRTHFYLRSRLCVKNSFYILVRIGCPAPLLSIGYDSRHEAKSACPTLPARPCGNHQLQPTLYLVSVLESDAAGHPNLQPANTIELVVRRANRTPQPPRL